MLERRNVAMLGCNERTLTLAMESALRLVESLSNQC
jgi:hypothetical protein